MTALCAALAPEFGNAKVFRPYRDVRFAKDKTPYKTHQGAFVAAGPATGWYVEVSARGVRTGAGFYEASCRAAGRVPGRHRRRPHRHRAGADPRALDARRLVEIGGDTLKTSPRGYDADHPRIELLRHKSLFAGHSHGFEPVIHTPELLDLVRDDWRALRPLVEWVADHADER